MKLKFDHQFSSSCKRKKLSFSFLHTMCSKRKICFPSAQPLKLILTPRSVSTGDQGLVLLISCVFLLVEFLPLGDKRIFEKNMSQRLLRKQFLNLAYLTIDSNKSQKYSKILKFFYFPL